MVSTGVRYEFEPFSLGSHEEHSHPTRLHWVWSMGEIHLSMLTYWESEIDLLLQHDLVYSDCRTLGQLRSSKKQTLGQS